MLLNNNLLDSLSIQAQSSPRLRMHLDLRNSLNDKSQRMLNALEPGTFIPIHRHCNTSETVIVLRGRVKWSYYNDSGNVTDCFIVSPQGNVMGLNVPKGQWHSLECLESGTVILSSKDGIYEPMADNDILYR